MIKASQVGPRTQKPPASGQYRVSKPDPTLSSSIRKVGASRAISLAVSFLCTVVTVRVTLDQFGPTIFGAISLLSTLLALLPFADLGLGVALTNLVVEEKHGLHDGKVQIGYASTIWTLTVVGVTTVGLSLLTSALDYWPKLLGQSMELLANSELYMPIYSVLFALWLLGGPAYRLLYGQGRSSLVMLLQGVIPILTLVGTVIAATLHFNPYFFAFVPLVSTIIVSTLAHFLAMHSIAGSFGARYLIPPWKVRAKEYKRFLKTGLGGLGLVAGTAILLQSDRLIASFRSDPEELAKIAILLPLYAAIQSVLGAFGSYLWPHYAAVSIRGPIPRQLIKKHSAAFTVVGLIFAIAFLAASQLYMALIGYSNVGTMVVLLMLSTLVIVQSAHLVPSSIAMRSASIAPLSVASLAGAALKIVLAWAFIPSLGAAGAIGATVIAVVLIQIPVSAWLVSRHSTAHNPPPEEV
jgi:O-antigen/teichoic acid export membrane protein